MGREQRESVGADGVEARMRSRKPREPDPHVFSPHSQHHIGQDQDRQIEPSIENGSPRLKVDSSA